MIRAQARQDIEDITTNTNEWAKALSFIAPTGETATINGVHVKHHMPVEDDGDIVNSRVARATFVWKLLEDQGYPTTKNDALNFDKHQLSVADSTGTQKHYIIREWFPDITTGLVVCILGDKE